MVALTGDVKFAVTLERKKSLKMRCLWQMHLPEQNLHSFSDREEKVEYT